MRKLLAFALIMIMCMGSLAACGKEQVEESTSTTEPTAEPTAAPTEAPADTESDLTAAGNYIYAMYKDSAVNTASDYTVVGVVMIGTTAYTVEWSTDAESGITVLEPENKMVTIDVDEQSAKEISYNLIATITDGENTVVKKFPHVLPAFKEFSFADYVAAKDDDTVVCKGVITAMLSKTKGNSSNSIYFQDSDGGYYVYNLVEDPYTELGLAEGMTIRATGIRDTYSGTYEIINTTVEVLDKNINIPAPVDFTEIYTNAESLTDAALVGPQSMLVTIKGVEITTQDAGSGYYRFKLADKESYIRISSSSCPLVKDDQNIMIANHTEHTGYLADATGLICVYNGAFYLTPVTADAFSNFRLPEKSDAEKVEYEAGNIVINDVLADTEITLNTTGVTYADVAISYEVSGDAAVYADGVLSIKLLEDASTVTVKATVTCGAETKVVELTVPVDAMATDVYVAKKAEEPVAETAYKFSVAQNNVGKTIYFTGEMNGNYLATSDKADKAVDVFAEAVDGGYRLYFTKDGVKTYIDIYEYADFPLKDVALYLASATYTWKAEFATFVTNVAGADYYLGCYNKYETISASKTSYITAENVDVSQFPARLTVLKTVPVEISIADTPVAGTTYKFAVAQNNVGKTVYFTGEMDRNYLATDDRLSKAVEVTVEEVEGGFRMFFMNGDVKTYIDIHEYTEGKAGIQLTEAPTATYTWNAEFKTFVANVAGADYYLGCYKTYETISASNISYITAENADVSQFPSRLYIVQ